LDLCAFYRHRHHRELLSFSTRRSSDLKQGSRVQTWFTAGKVLAIVAIVALGFALGGRVDQHFVGSAQGASDTLGGFLLAMAAGLDRKSTRLNSSHVKSSYAVFCLNKKK